MLSKMLSPHAVEKQLMDKNSQKEPSSNSEKTNEKNGETDERVSRRSAAPSSLNSNWEKYKHIVNPDETKPKLSKRQHSQSSKPRKFNRKMSSTIPQEVNSESENRENTTEEKDKQKTGITKQIAMDCEMVGIGDGTESMLARVSLVNRHGVCIYDKYVKPREKIVDYRTPVSGIRPHHLADGEDFKVVQTEVSGILRGRLLIGHAVRHDLNVLFLKHPKRLLRDTSQYKPFRKLSSGNTPSLKKLAVELLGIDIQKGEHNSVEDARTAMQLYCLYKNQWESSIYSRH